MSGNIHSILFYGTAHPGSLNKRTSNLATPHNSNLLPFLG